MKIYCLKKINFERKIMIKGYWFLKFSRKRLWVGTINKRKLSQKEVQEGYSRINTTKN
jgi:hypothetical protein